MSSDELRFLEEKLDFLQKEKSETLAALESILDTDNLLVSLNKLESKDAIIDRAFGKVSKLIKIKSAGFLLVDEANSFFTPASFYPEDCRDVIMAETDKLIMDNTFALAIKAGKCITVRCKEHNAYLLVHVLSTISRTRGMFVCLLDMHKEDIPDAIFTIITVVMRNTAHLLESFELYSRNRQTTDRLAESVDRLEKSEVELKSFNERLELEVENRTKELKATNDLLENEISERKKIEKLLTQQKEALQSLNETLESRVQVETENRRKSEQILHEQSKLAAMGQMMSAISHQWRQPLNALGLVIQDMLDEYAADGGLSKEYLEEMVGKSLKLILHMSSTIDDFCNIVDVDKSESSEFEVISAVNEVVMLINNSFNSLGIFFDVDCEMCKDGKSTLVKGDRGIFNQVLLNIFSNSRDSIQEKLSSGKISRGIISIKVESEGADIVIRAVDNGGGVPPEVIGRVFEPYFTTKEDQKGTGLGLYMSKLFIEEQMKGNISIANSGEGAEICLRFPLFS